MEPRSVVWGGDGPEGGGGAPTAATESCLTTGIWTAVSYIFHPFATHQKRRAANANLVACRLHVAATLLQGTVETRQNNVREIMMKAAKFKAAGKIPESRRETAKAKKAKAAIDPILSQIALLEEQVVRLQTRVASNDVRTALVDSIVLLEKDAPSTKAEEKFRKKLDTLADIGETNGEPTAEEQYEQEANDALNIDEDDLDDELDEFMNDNMCEGSDAALAEQLLRELAERAEFEEFKKAKAAAAAESAGGSSASSAATADRSTKPTRAADVDTEIEEEDDVAVADAILEGGGRFGETSAVRVGK